MLELTKILHDIDNLGREKAESLSALGDELSTADGVVSLIEADMDTARARIDTARTSWLTAGFVDPPGRVTNLPSVPSAYAVTAVDGSQIVPDKHEVALCYLLNASAIIIYYGTPDSPIARTEPRLCYREEDLFEDYGDRKVPVADKQLSMRRTLAESAQLEWAIHTASKAGIPVVALWDGSLIRWSLENEPPEYKKRVLSEYLRAFDLAKELGIPIAGYISDPGSRDVVNSFRIMLCDQIPVDCDKCPHRKAGVTAPCDALSRLKDSGAFARRLKGGKRSVLFTSKSRILKDYREHNVHAFYMDSGREVVRVEVPEWVMKDRSLLDLVHAVCHDQAAKGRGYPVALAEAHERAVIRGPERSAFYSVLERSFIKHGAPISYSLKRISKNY